MWTININRVEGQISVRVNRWPRGQRYPAQLADVEMLDCPDESELALISRAALAVHREVDRLRFEKW